MTGGATFPPEQGFLMAGRLGQAFHRVFGPKPIIQFSPPRSGSTLVFNIVREVLPDRKIDKTHNYNPKFAKHKVVVTYRHPLDSIASGIQRYGRTPSDQEIENQIEEFNASGIWELLDIRDKLNVLMLRYDNFYNNFAYIFDSLEKFFRIEIPEEQRAEISEKYKIEVVQKVAQQFDSFHAFDEVTHWHGKHISEYKGTTYYYKEFFTRPQIDYLKSVYKEILVAFDYE